MSMSFTVKEISFLAFSLYLIKFNFCFFRNVFWITFVKYSPSYSKQNWCSRVECYLGEHSFQKTFNRMTINRRECSRGFLWIEWRNITIDTWVTTTSDVIPGWPNCMYSIE